MQSLAMASRSRGSSGEQIPTADFYPKLEANGIRFWKSQLVLVVSPGGGGKSALIANLVAKWGRPALMFLLDQDAATAAARMAATALDAPFLDLKRRLDEPDVQKALSGLGYIHAAFKAEALDDIQLQLDAYIERYGEPPEIMVVDNLGNMTSGDADEWQMLKGLTLDLDIMARRYGMLVLAAAHTGDSPSTEPLPRDRILGKLHQFPRLIISIASNPFSGEYKLCAVKNSSGPQDPTAANPLVFECDLASMQIREWTREPPAPAGKALADFQLLKGNS